MAVIPFSPNNRFIGCWSLFFIICVISKVRTTDPRQNANLAGRAKRQYSAPPPSAAYGGPAASVTANANYHQVSSSASSQAAPSTYGKPTSNVMFTFGGQPAFGSSVSGSATSYGSASSSSLTQSAQYGTSASAYASRLHAYGSAFPVADAALSAPVAFYGTSSGAYGAPAGPSALITTSYGNQYGRSPSSSASGSLISATGWNGHVPPKNPDNVGSSGNSNSYGSPPATTAPTCVQSLYNISISDQTGVGVIILRVLAVDSRGLPLGYEILDSVFGAVDINQQTGDITVAASLVNFARALEFTVQVTNSQNQKCTSTVRINLVQASAALTATPSAYPGGGGYGSPASPLISAPAPPAYSPNFYPAPAPPGSYPVSTISPNPAPNGYGGGSVNANLIATTVQPPYPIAFPTPSSYSGGSSGNLVVNTPPPYNPATFPGFRGNPTIPPNFSESVGYGGSDASLVATNSPPISVTFPPPGAYSDGSTGNLMVSPTSYIPVTPSGYTNDQNAEQITNYVSSESTYGGSNLPLISTETPPNPVTFPPVSSIRQGEGGKSGSDGFPAAPVPMNWSFFVSDYSGLPAVVGAISPSGNGAVYTVTGNPFFTVDQQTGDVRIASGYCPASSPMQEVLTVTNADSTGATVQGNVSVVIFVTPGYLLTCRSNPQAQTLPTTTHIQPTQASIVTPHSGGINVIFTGDTSFTVGKCDSAPNIPLLAASIRAKFTPNVDFSQLKITVSNSLFQPGLPVACDQQFVCNISVIFSQPIDASFQGSYLVSVNIGGGGLAPSSQALQILVRCNDPAADQVPVPPRRGVDPSLIVPELPPCGQVPSVPVDVNEDIPVGSIVTMLPQDRSANIRYRIVDSSASGYFDMSDQGAIAVSSPLSEPTVDSVFLRVVGMMGDQKVCGIDVYIGIKNVNRNKPTFDQDTYNFATDCNLPMSLVGTVSATDTDRGRNNIRRFFLSPEDTTLASVDPASGSIHLRNKLQETSWITVFVENPGTNLRSSVQVLISCTGDNSIVHLGGVLGRSAPRPSTTPGPGGIRMRSDPRAHAPVTSNKPISFPFIVSMEKSATGSHRQTATSRPRTSSSGRP